MEAARSEAIARQFLPSRWHYYYTRSKLATDPLYAAVAAALGPTTAPLLDLGCGVGLLAHYCAAQGLEFPYRGLDNDAGKIALANGAATRAGLTNTQFAVADLAQEWPAHHGSIALLDVLQFLPPGRLPQTLARAATCVSPAGRLIIRTGLQDTSWRTRVTRAADWFARAVHWMNAAPRAYPTREGLVDLLVKEGLVVEIKPLWGNTPFNNWLLVARHPLAAPSANRARQGSPAPGAE